MSKARFLKIALLAGCVFQLGGIIRTCYQIIDVIETPITLLASLDQLGIIDVTPA